MMWRSCTEEQPRGALGFFYKMSKGRVTRGYSEIAFGGNVPEERSAAGPPYTVRCSSAGYSYWIKITRVLTLRLLGS